MESANVGESGSGRERNGKEHKVKKGNGGIAVHYHHHPFMNASHCEGILFLPFLQMCSFIRCCHMAMMGLCAKYLFYVSGVADEAPVGGASKMRGCIQIW